MLSSALGERRVKFSQASYKIAEGEVDPGRNTETDDARPDVVNFDIIKEHNVRLAWNFLDEFTGIRSDYTDTIRFADSENRTRVKIPTHTIE